MLSTAPVLFNESAQVLRTGNVLQYCSPLRQELRVGLEHAQLRPLSTEVEMKAPNGEPALLSTPTTVPCNTQKITVKLFLQSPAASAACIKQALFATLNELGVHQVDMLLLLDLGGAADFSQYWEEAEQLVDLGYVRSIGVMDFDPAQLSTLLSHARIKPFANQIAIDTLTRGPPSMELLDLCSKNGIKLLAGSSDELAGVREAVQSSLNGHCKWLVNYVSQLKCRGVLTNRGYLIECSHTGDLVSSS